MIFLCTQSLQDVEECLSGRYHKKMSRKLRKQTPIATAIPFPTSSHIHIIQKGTISQDRDGQETLRLNRGYLGEEPLIVYNFKSEFNDL
jgi:hypothetical protein